MKKTDQPIIIFDGVCNLCEYSVKFIVKYDRQGRFKFVSAQSERGKVFQHQYGVDTLQDGTVILLKNGQVFVKSDAAVEIARDLDGLWRFLRVLTFIPKTARDFVYSIISKNRYRWFGKKMSVCFQMKLLKTDFYNFYYRPNNADNAWSCRWSKDLG